MVALVSHWILTTCQLHSPLNTSMAPHAEQRQHGMPPVAVLCIPSISGTLHDTGVHRHTSKAESFLFNFFILFKRRWGRNLISKLAEHIQYALLCKVAQFRHFLCTLDQFGHFVCKFDQFSNDRSSSYGHQTRFQGFTELFPPGARKRSYIRTQHSLRTST